MTRTVIIIPFIHVLRNSYICLPSTSVKVSYFIVNSYVQGEIKIRGIEPPFRHLMSKNNNSLT